MVPQLAEALREQMMVDPEFRELALEHSRYDGRLSELVVLPFPTPQEQLEEKVLKKKKLAVKDRMQTMLMARQVGESSGHWHPRG